MKQIYILLVLAIGLVLASSYSGDGTYSVQAGDIILGNNHYSITINEISSSIVSFQMGTGYTTSLSEGEEGNFSLAAMGGPKVLNVRINSIDNATNTASIAIASIYVADEQPEIPTPRENPMENNITSQNYKGDGVYTLNLGDRIISDSGYAIEFNNTATGTDRYGGEVKAVVVKIYDRDNLFLSDAFLDVGDSQNTVVSEQGLTVIVQEMGTNSVKMKVSSGLTITLYPGWNLFSAPLYWSAAKDTCEDERCSGPGTNGLKVMENTCGDLESLKIWHWDTEAKQYSKSSPYSPFGYWLKVTEQCSITFGSEIVTLDYLELKQGWNQIGGPTKSVNINDIKGNCVITSGPWRYLNSLGRYEKTATLAAGGGYFIKVADDCRFAESSPPAPPQ